MNCKKLTFHPLRKLYDAHACERSRNNHLLVPKPNVETLSPANIINRIKWPSVNLPMC